MRQRIDGHNASNNTETDRQTHFETYGEVQTSYHGTVLFLVPERFRVAREGKLVIRAPDDDRCSAPNQDSGIGLAGINRHEAS